MLNNFTGIESARFEEHIKLTSRYLDVQLSDEEIKSGVKRLASAPGVFGETTISVERQEKAVGILLKAKNQSS